MKRCRELIDTKLKEKEEKSTLENREKGRGKGRKGQLFPRPANSGFAFPFQNAQFGGHPSHAQFGSMVPQS